MTPDEGDLPSGWTYAALADVAELNPSLPDLAPTDDELVSFVPMAAVEANSGRLDPSETRPWKEVKRAFTRFQEGDVLFAKITPSMENGKCALASGLAGGRGAGSTEFHVLRSRTAIEPKFILHYLLRESFRRQARAKMKGVAGQLRVPPEFMAQEVLPVAPLSEQHRIVAEIEKHFTRLDAAVAALERARANLKRYRASVLKAACEGRLVPTEAELARAEGRVYEPAEVLLERVLRARRARWETDQLEKMRAAGKEPKDDRWKARYKEPTPPDVEGLPELPEGWTWATIEQLTAHEPNALTDGPFGSNLKTSHYTTDGPRVIRLQNIGDGRFLDTMAHISEDHYRRLAKHQIRAGDLVIAALGDGLPRACVIPPSVGPAIVKADCIRFKPQDGLSLPGFLNVALNAEATRRQVAETIHGVGRPRLNLGEIKSISLPLPPISEQLRIVADAERRLSVIDELDEAIDHARLRAARLHQSILKRAFEGKLVPQDPNDEPASVLLERIRAEREKEVVARPARVRGRPSTTPTRRRKREAQ